MLALSKLFAVCASARLEYWNRYGIHSSEGCRRYPSLSSSRLGGRYMPTICREPRFLEFRIVASCVGCIGSIPSCQARLISSHNKAERIHRFPSPSPTGGYAQLQGAFSITQRPLNQTITLGFFPGHSWTPPLKLRRS